MRRGSEVRCFDQRLRIGQTGADICQRQLGVGGKKLCRVEGGRELLEHLRDADPRAAYNRFTYQNLAVDDDAILGEPLVPGHDQPWGRAVATGNVGRSLRACKALAMRASGGTAIT